MGTGRSRYGGGAQSAAEDRKPGWLAFLWFALVATALSLGMGALVAPSTAAAVPEPPAPGKELPALATERSRTYLAPDGTHVTRLFQGTVNFKDARGKLQPVDNTLVASAAPGYAVENKANRYRVQLPRDLGGAPVRLERGEAWVSLALEGAQAPAATAANRATYAGALPGVDVRYSVQADQVKEDLVLRSAAAPSVYTFALRLSPGLRAQANRAGGIDVRDAQGHLQFALEPPFAYDAAGRLGPASLRLGGDGRISLTANRAWLDDPKRRYPVTVDPTFSMDPNQDCTIASAVPTTAACTDDLRVGATAGTEERALLRFDVAPQISKGSRVLGARLRMWSKAASTTSDIPVALHAVEADWNAGASWNTRDGATAWTAQGGDFAATADASRQVGAATGWHEWHPSVALLQRWVDNPAEDFGFLVKGPGAAAPNSIAFASDESATDQRPFLEVTYDRGLGRRPEWTYETEALNDRTELHVNVANGNLLLESRDLAISGTGLDLDLTRSYNNLSSTDRQLGPGWSIGHGRDMRLSALANGDRLYEEPNGATHVFARTADGGYRAPADLQATLVRNTDDSHTLTFPKTKEKLRFRAGNAPYLAERSDGDGNRISSGLSTTSQLDSLTDTQGRVTRFERDAAGRIAKVIDPAGQTLLYEHDAAGRITRYVDAALKTTAYEYDAAGNLTKITDPLGHETRIAYDSQRRVTALTRVTDPATGAGPTTSFSYFTNDGYCLGAEFAGKTRVVAPVGNETTVSGDHQTLHCYDTQRRVTKTLDARGKTRVMTYTASSELKTETDELNATETFAYDARDNLTQDTQPTGAGTSLAYAASEPDQPSRETNPQGNSLAFGYDAAGNLTSITSELLSQNQRRLAYNPNGTLASVVDERGNTTAYGYDAKGNLTAVTPPAPLGAESFAYDALGRMTRATDGTGQATTLGYDAFGRRTSATFADGTKVTEIYNANGNRTARTDATGTTTYRYDALNRPLEETAPGGATVAYSYDANGNLASLTDGGGTVRYSYGSTGWLTSLEEPGGARTTFAYDDEGKRTATNYPNGVVMTQTYDAADNVASVTTRDAAGALLKRSAYSYVKPSTGRATDLRHSVQDETGKKTEYSYDALDRLVRAATYSAGTLVDDYRYSYDGAGNRLTQTHDGAATRYSYNGANQLTSVDGASLSYDANGAETTGAGGRTTTYNAAGQAASITATAGATPTSLGYAGPGQKERVRAGETAFGHSSLGVVSARTGTETAQYFTRDNAGRLVGLRTGAATYYYSFDGHRSVVGLTDAAGKLAASYDYDPFGQLVASSGSVVNPWRFAGQYHDPSGLYKMGERYYDPALGRWTQQDPLDQFDTPKEGNRYVYAANDPINNTDTTGLYGCGPGAVGRTRLLDRGRAFNFSAACDWHDLCYEHHWYSQRTCDNHFFGAMRGWCNGYWRHGSIRHRSCHRRARYYYRAVNRFGGRVY